MFYSIHGTNQQLDMRQDEVLREEVIGWEESDDMRSVSWRSSNGTWLIVCSLQRA